MKSDRIGEAWAASGNRLQVVEAKAITDAFITELGARNARFNVGIAAVAIAFLVLSVLSLMVVLQRDIDPIEAWALLPLNVLMWSGLGTAIVWRLRERRPPSHAGVPILDAIRYALEQRQAHQSRLRLIAAGLLLSLPMVALSIQQMIETGRLEVADLPRQIALALGAYGVAFACLGSDYFGHTAREVERLAGRLAECERCEEALPTDDTGDA